MRPSPQPKPRPSPDTSSTPTAPSFPTSRSPPSLAIAAPLKFFPIRERLRLQIRSEFFNITNTPQFAPPNAVLGAPAFDTVNTRNNQPRIIQFTMKLLF